MEILRSPSDNEYPTEYLLARIRGRRVYLIRDWDTIVFNPEPHKYLLSTRYGELLGTYASDGIWKNLLKELQWVYHQMNRGLIHIFQPFFIYAEIKTIILCLRHKTAQGALTEIESILLFSLLSDKIKDLFRMKTDFLTSLEMLEKVCISPSAGMTGLRDVFAEDGLKAVEQLLTGMYLKKILRAGLHPVIKSFFVSLIDSKNIMAAYKHLRWGIHAEPVFIPGGSIRESRLKKVVETGRIEEISLLISRYTGISIEETTASGIDVTLQRGMTKMIKMMSRESSGIGLLLDYLWKCSVEARNLSIIISSREIDRNILKRELAI
jgi:vacuolar-type H+-ATPase subunit C/Vma6